MTRSLLRNQRRLAKKAAARNPAQINRGKSMSEQNTTEQLSPEQQIANLKGAIAKKIEDVLDVTNMLRDIVKLFEANLSLGIERKALNEEIEKLKAQVADLSKPKLTVVADETPAAE